MHNQFPAQTRSAVTALREVIGAVIRGRMDKKQATYHLKNWTQANIGSKEREQFREIAESEPLSLHEGNFAGLPDQAD